ncbi:MAG: hypothetical protein FD180_717 [Planctomycetota bacterium]|nr:MAG: hypothetical protein FD180_717 [Planctomycetota bacterium]
MDDANSGYSNAALRDLNAHEINANPAVSRPCTLCRSGQVPTVGSYASTMWHFERVLGAFPRPRSQAKCLVLFEEPGKNVRFTACSPLVDPRQLKVGEHRYFCLTPMAWENLKLPGRPRWPDEETAPEFLRRYFRASPWKWSYDGMIAFFLWLLRPADAYVTNVAKCYFKGQGSDVFETCADAHLAREFELFGPDLVLSFTSEFNTERFRRVSASRSIALLQLYHPAAWGHVKPAHKIERLLGEVKRNQRSLASLGIDVEELSSEWRGNSARALQA